MAIVTGTYTRYDAKGLREQLTEQIFNISPQETPLSSSISRGSCSQTLFEWQTDSLAAAAANAQIEGDEVTFSAPSATVRVGNYTQISREEVIISGTLEAVDKAGRRSEIAYQLAKKGAELKRDMEFDLLSAQGGAAGSSSVARKLAALNAWIKTNSDFGTGGADPTYSSGVPGAARTDGTQRALTETIAKTVIKEVWTAGGEPKVLMVGPHNKTVASGFSGIATRNFDLSNVSPKPTAIIGAADVWVTDFGTLRIIPNRFQRERDGWVLDWSLLSLRFLRPVFTEKLAKTGDAEKRAMWVEYTLQVKQEAGLGIIADLTTS